MVGWSPRGGHDERFEDPPASCCPQLGRSSSTGIRIDHHFEKVDLGEIALPIRERHEDLAAQSLPFRDRVIDDGHADVVPLADQQLVESRGHFLSDAPTFDAGGEPVILSRCLIRVSANISPRALALTMVRRVSFVSQ
jgi:hypothetical protein